MGDEQASGGRTYQIGTVSSLTGIDVHTIRAWERRHGAIKPRRSEKGRRLYDDQTVERLQLLKGLVDCNEAIGQIAHLSDSDLRSRLAKLAEHGDQASRMAATGETADRPRVALLAPAIAAQIAANAVSMADFDLRFSDAEADDFVPSLQEAPCDLVLLELGTVDDAALRQVQACLGAPCTPHLIVLYRFASRVALARVARAGATVVRMPIRLESLRRILLDQMMIRRALGHRSAVASSGTVTVTSRSEVPTNTSATLRRFDDAQLARLLELTSAVGCECPNHLSSLISGLVAFEEYSRACESKDAADADQHRRLAIGTAEARARMERLLVELCEHEGIAV